MVSQEDFERLSKLMADKGVIHEGFELLADLRKSETELQGKVKELEEKLENTERHYEWLMDSDSEW